jgi:hypothetical protein
MTASVVSCGEKTRPGGASGRAFFQTAVNSHGKRDIGKLTGVHSEIQKIDIDAQIRASY